jgi:hypothetical protein
MLCKISTVNINMPLSENTKIVIWSSAFLVQNVRGVRQLSTS